MKKFSFLLAFLVFSSISYAQSPEYINYQAVLRDANQNLITSISCNSCSVNVKIEVLETSTSSSSYTEIHTEAPNAYGLINFKIGGGTTSDNFSSLDWANKSYWIRTSYDLNNDNAFEITGTPDNG